MTSGRLTFGRARDRLGAAGPQLTLPASASSHRTDGLSARLAAVFAAPPPKTTATEVVGAGMVAGGALAAALIPWTAFLAA
jgi:hypothetical protein